MFHSQDFLGLSDSATCGIATTTYRQLPAEVQREIMQFMYIPINEEESFTRASQLTSNHCTYSVGSFIVVDLVHGEDIPLFMKLLYLLCYRGTWCLCGKIYAAESFDSNINGYRIKDCQVWLAILPGQEVDPHLLHSYKNSSDDDCIALRYRVVKK
jgi:hypothetical protein